MGKKEKKSKTAEQKARIAAKENKKATQKVKKAKSKDDDKDDVDLQAVLDEYSRQQAKFLRVSESSCDPPSPRSSATFIGSPSSNKELFLFGGEYYNGVFATFFNDLFIYLIDKDEWRKVTSPNSPLPRSGHAWCRSDHGTNIYLFGGEFSSPKQGTFYHYNDFWKLEPSTREWTRIETKGKGPPARSGHRMTHFKNYIVLFGGFQDTSQTTKYLQDLWIYDCRAFRWHNTDLPPASQKPDARSSFSFLPHPAGAVIVGGYSRVKSTVAAGKQSKGGKQGNSSRLKPRIHEDTWFLRITPPTIDASANAVPTIRWERRKSPVNRPSPRAGVNMVYHKGRGILFGGVHDVEESEEGIDSEFFNALFAWNIERNRFFQLTLKPAKVTPKNQGDGRGTAKRARGKADEVELLCNLAALQAKDSIANTTSEVFQLDTDMPDVSTNLVKPVLNTMPHPRFNAHLAVQDDVLYMLGGTYEHADAEYTFDEMWAIDLGKLDGVHEVYRRELDHWQGSDEEESDSQSESAESDAGDEDDGVQIDDPSPSVENKEHPPSEAPAEADQEQTEAATVDSRPQPRPFENLRDFFNRTSIAWQDTVLESLRHDGNLNKSVKELRKIAFDLSEAKWWDSREEITALEDEQEEAGIGEVINIADRNNDTGDGAGRKR
ncbi:MAG: hypothetical protein HETSPECPRED_006978 [Heterodermia speciosa]|uniref:DUF4110 domain-containing protein n=1 Tax=Heterodermia speciosa TaxID=116794 RepID=A0A8H3EGN6_9LECA|nr:MAG: hypothetical protein HETSPECPRED_006978 [Heterodermia speciosa]